MSRWTGLTARLAVLSLLQIVGVFLGAALIYRAVGTAPHPILKLPAELVAITAAEHWDEPAMLAKRIAVMSERLEASVEVFDLADRPVASAGSAMGGSNTFEARASVARDGRALGSVLLRRAYLPHPPLQAGLVAASVAAVVLALGSWLLSRSVTLPLVQMAAVARRLGEGDLSARVGRLRSRNELGQLAEAFDSMAVRLQKLVTAHSELLANVSHELRTPLARARVALDLAHEEAMVDREALAEVSSDLHELEQIVNDVLVAARLSLAQGRASDVLARLPKQTADLCAITAAAAERFRKQYPHIPFESTCPDVPVQRLVADTLLRRALDNLLDNAAGHGGGAPVALTLQVTPAAVTFEVCDQGPGMRPDDAERAFEPFFRADPSRSKIGGLGLGLTLARRVVEAHGGTATLQSAPGEGTRVRLALPVTTADADPGQESA